MIKMLTEPAILQVLIFFFTAFFVSLAASLLAFQGSFPGWWALTVSLVAAAAQGFVALRALVSEAKGRPSDVAAPGPGVLPR